MTSQITTQACKPRLIVRVWKSVLTACTPFSPDRREEWEEESCMYAEPMASMTLARILDPEKELEFLTKKAVPMYATVSLIGGAVGESEGVVSGKISRSIKFPIGWINTLERSPLPFKIGTASDCQVNPNKLRKDCFRC